MTPAGFFCALFPAFLHDSSRLVTYFNDFLDDSQTLAEARWPYGLISAPLFTVREEFLADSKRFVKQARAECSRFHRILVADHLSMIIRMLSLSDVDTCDR